MPSANTPVPPGGSNTPWSRSTSSTRDCAGARRSTLCCRPGLLPGGGLNEGTAFATKPELAARMIGRYLGVGHRMGWVAGDEVCGGNPRLRSAL